MPNRPGIPLANRRFDNEPATELPVEHEQIQDAWYQSDDHTDLVWGRHLEPKGKTWFRLGPVARYEPPKPEKQITVRVFESEARAIARELGQLSISTTPAAYKLYQKLVESLNASSEGVEL